jgi:hypothetical protein
MRWRGHLAEPLAGADASTHANSDADADPDAHTNSDPDSDANAHAPAGRRNHFHNFIGRSVA